LRSARRSRISTRTCSTSAPSASGSFDLVLLLGVLYHLPDPWPVLERAAAVTAGTLVIETHGDFLDVRRPALAYYPSDGLDGDPSNWWGPNPPLLRARLRALGFERVELVHHSEWGHAVKPLARVPRAA